ncbi:hypothetical protein GGS21DRAFT_532375 [Xylaria nigripes]|nr:hypothetical protein GGS21DRAFT_532375 [Xylaria nigripes]
MYHLGHEDPTVSVAKYIPGAGPAGNDGDLKSGLNHHRTARYRLSCISESQKENSRHSEDEFFTSIGQTPKTPVLEPVRWSHSRHQSEANSPSSDDASSISPFQLDLNQVETCREQSISRRRRLVLSNWYPAVSGKSDVEVEQHEVVEASGTRPKTVGPTSPKILEVQWRIIRWTAVQPGVFYPINQQRTRLGTGLDGPRSSPSGNSPPRFPSDASSTPLGPSAMSNCSPCESRRREAETLGSIGWEKRKPRKRHDVSETSDLDRSAHLPQPNTPSIMGTMDNPILEEQEHEFDNSEGEALKSCPEFYRRSVSGVPPVNISTFGVERDGELKPPNYSEFDNNRHRHHFHVPDRFSKRFHSLRDRLHRFRSSSMHSIRPEFPPPPDGKERRYRSRNSNDIWPSSGEESPIFNTPESRISPMQPTVHRTDLSSASGLMNTTGELDRLALSTNEGSLPRTSTTLSDLARLSNDTSSSRSGSGSSIVDSPPSDSAKLPFLQGSHSRPLNTISRAPQIIGRHSRRQQSRLSEMTTPVEIKCLAQPVDSDMTLHRLAYTYSDPLQDNLLDSQTVHPEFLVSRHLSMNPSGSSDDELNHNSWLASVSNVTQMSPPHKRTLADGPNIKPEEQGFRRVQILEPSGKRISLGNRDNTGQHTTDQTTSKMQLSNMTITTKPPRTRSLELPRERMTSTQATPLSQDEPASTNAVQRQPTLEKFALESCHPDTWTPGQGEPGDSEPFCPPDCLLPKQCHHNP